MRDIKWRILVVLAALLAVSVWPAGARSAGFEVFAAVIEVKVSSTSPPTTIAPTAQPAPTEEPAPTAEPTPTPTPQPAELNAQDESYILEITGATFNEQGDTITISVQNTETGEGFTTDVAFSVSTDEEYITIQAVDEHGNRSRQTLIGNPYYSIPEPTPEPSPEVSDEPSETPEPSPEPAEGIIAIPAPSETPSPSEEAAANAASNAFTLDGAGEVVDNIQGGNNKEFFTITSDDGSEFYLIIDRERPIGNNVYFLNAVTDADLAALAQKREDEQAKANPTPATNAIPAPAPTEKPTETPAETPAPAAPPAQTSGNSDAAMYIFIGVAALIAVGAGYYFKIYKPRQAAPNYENTGEGDEDDEDEDEGDENEGGEDEDEDDENEGGEDDKEYEFEDEPGGTGTKGKSGKIEVGEKPTEHEETVEDMDLDSREAENGEGSDDDVPV